MKSTPSPSGKPEVEHDEIGLARARFDQPLAAPSRPRTPCQPSPPARRGRSAGSARSSSTTTTQRARLSHAAPPLSVASPAPPRSAGGAPSGSVKRERVRRRRPVLGAEIVPPCASTIARQIASPSPTPGVARFALRRAMNISKSFFLPPVGKPGPSSLDAHLDEVAPATLRRRSRSTVPGGEYFAAFSSRLQSTRSISTASNSTSGRSRRNVDRDMVLASERPRGAAQRAADHFLERLPLLAQLHLAALRGAPCRAGC